MNIKEILLGNQQTIEKRYELSRSETYTMGQIIGIPLVLIIGIFGWVTGGIWISLGIDYLIGISIVRFNL